MKTAENYKKPIVIRKIDNSIWQKFRVICKKQGIKSANKGVIKLIAECVAKEEETCSSKK